MTGWPLDYRVTCAVLMAIGAVLLAARLRPRAARAAWLGLLIAGLANALIISLNDVNLININVVHHYLGAKYSFPYGDFYKLINAARERPQTAMRDLDDPPAMFRDDPREQRAYYIDLMRSANLEFDPLVPLAELHGRVEEAGIIRQESQRILSEKLPAEQAEDFRRDARSALEGLGWDRDITTDYGFNGSPLYALIRHLDPTLHIPFSSATAWLNLLWQIAAALLIVWIGSIALDLDATARLATAALVFASWDFVGWALPGLVFAGLWLPIALALWALRRRRCGPAGLAIAWAGLMKLFPFILLLPAVVRLACAALRPGSYDRKDESSRGSLAILVWCALAVPALLALSMLGGRSWIDFLHKIVVQFQSDAYLLNSVSLSQGLLTIGVHGSPLPGLLSLVALAMLAAMFLYGGSEEFMSSLPRRGLVLIAAASWLFHTWFNYYAIAPLMLLPLLARHHRIAAAASALGMALAFALPEFDDPWLLAHPAVHGLKLAPYILIPAWFVALEFRAEATTRKAWRMIVVIMVTCAAATAGEAVRLATIHHLDEVGGQHLDRGDARGALGRFRTLVILAPWNAMAHMNLAIAQANLGDQKASEGFARAAALEPDSAVTRKNYGRWLLGAGRLVEAESHLQAARDLAPYDESSPYDLARLRLRQDRRAEAIGLLERALELNPDNRAVRNLLYQTRGP